MYKWREKEEELVSILRRMNILLRGPRQAGKTTLLKHIRDSVGGVYYTLDNPNVLSLFEKDPDSLVTDKVVFIDEIQESKNAGRILRYLIDTYPGTRFVLSGSGAFDIRLNISSYLVGRVHEINLLPLSFREFVKWRNESLFKHYDSYRASLFNFLNKGGNVKSSSLPGLEVLLDQYLSYGGYPKVVLSTHKADELNAIVKFMVQKDILSFFGIKYKEKLFSVLRNLAYRSGKLLDYSSLDVDYKTATFYISILKNSYVLELLNPFAKNPSLEIRKAKKLVFYDIGFRKSLSKLESGFVLEEFVFRQFLPDRYWRDKRKNEVDFLLDTTPIEVKKGGKLSKGFYSYIRHYKPERALVLHMSWDVDQVNYKGTEILYWPIYLI